MAESRSWCGHPGSGHWGAPGLPGRRSALTLLQRDAGLAERHKEDPSTIWQNPTFHPARQGRQIRQQNPSFEGPGRRRVFLAGAEWQIPRQARCGAPARSASRAALCAQCQSGWRPETHFGRPPAPPPALPFRLSPAGPASAWRRLAGAGPRRAAQVVASARVPAPARPSPLAPASGRCPAPREQAGPSPGAGLRQAHPAQLAPCVPVAGLPGEGGGDPSPHQDAAAATSRSGPPPPGSHGVVVGVGTLLAASPPAAWRGCTAVGASAATVTKPLSLPPLPLPLPVVRVRVCLCPSECVSACSAWPLLYTPRGGRRRGRGGLGGGGGGRGAGGGRKGTQGGGGRGGTGDLAHGEGVVVGGAG